MPVRIQIAPAVLGFVLLAGCSTAPATRKPAAIPASRQEPSAAATADYSTSAVTARTEAHAHYTAAILHELNDEAEKAAGEFYSCAPILQTSRWSWRPPNACSG
jgi:hypothetical protein